MNISAQLNAQYLYASYTVGTLQQQSATSAAAPGQAMREQSLSFSFVAIEVQSFTLQGDNTSLDGFADFLKEIGYTGTPIPDLSQEEAAALVADDGFFGIAKTAARISDFVINGAGTDESLLRAGREGILQGFKEAEALWGGKLPEISYKTIDKALEAIDMRLNELGYPILSEEV